MFGLIKTIFLTGLTVFSTLAGVNSLGCISVNNQDCKVRPEIIIFNGDEPVCDPFTIKTSKCSGSCNNIIDPYAKMCVPDVINLNLKVFNLMSRTTETRRIKRHKTWKYKSTLDASVCNNKRRWNDDKCRCECKELIDKNVYNKGYISNPSKCECECNKSCDVGECLDYENCNCRKRMVDKFVEECNEIDEEVEIVGKNNNNNYYNNNNNNNNSVKCSSCIFYIVLFSIILIINIEIATYFVYFKYMNHNTENISKCDYLYQAKKY